MSESKSTNRTLWQSLFDPHADIAGEVDRRRVRTVSVLSLALIVVSLGLASYQVMIIRDATVIYTAPFLLLYVITYGLSRTRQALWSARLLVFGTAALDFVILLTVGQQGAVTTLTTFVLVPILFATVVVDAWQTLLLAFLINAGLGVFFLFGGQFDFQAMMGPFLGTLAVSILAAVTALLRERDVAIIRDQQQTLDRHSQNLEDQIDQRTRNIVATAEIGRVAAGARDLEVMLRQVVGLIKERFNYYYAQVFLLDDSGKQAVLRAGTGAAGEEFLTRGHRLPVGSQSVIGQVTATGIPIVVVDTDTDPMHRRNELLPLTRSELALPLRVSGRVIGALNIQSTTVNAFQSTEVTVFQTIADQMAVAIENTRLFERAQRDLQDIETLNRQLTGEAWRKYLTGRLPGLPTGYSGSSAGVAAMQGAGEDIPREGTVSMPLKVRGETIGMLDVTPRSGQAPDEQMKSMLEAVAERVALALDSTRVGEQAQRQAEREQILSAISAELQATTDLNVILRAVARETSRALGVPHSFIHLAMSYATEQKPEEDTSTERKKAK